MGGGTTCQKQKKLSRQAKNKGLTRDQLAAGFGEQSGKLYRATTTGIEHGMDATLGVAGRELGRWNDAISGKQDSSGAAAETSSSANYTSKTGKTSQGTGKKADMAKDKKKPTGGKSQLYAKK